MKPTLLPVLVVALVAAACQPATPRRSAEPGFDARTSCARLALAWRDYDAGHVSRAAYWRGARTFVDNALACGDPELAFAGFMVGPTCGDDRACRSADGTHLARLERAGVPLKAAFAAWLAARDLSALGATVGYRQHEPYRSVQETARWLARSGYREFARPVATLALAQRDPYVQAALLEYFVALALPEGEPLARRLLTHRDPGMRLRACRAMARLGSPAALPAVRAVATHDPHSRLIVVAGVDEEVYPVRAGCAEAAAAVTARAANPRRPSVAAAR
jgi:hypothetical protein